MAIKANSTVQNANLLVLSGNLQVYSCFSLLDYTSESLVLWTWYKTKFNTNFSIFCLKPLVLKWMNRGSYTRYFKTICSFWVLFLNWDSLSLIFSWILRLLQELLLNKWHFLLIVFWKIYRLICHWYFSG